MITLIYSAIIPTILLMFWIYSRDKINPEPKQDVLRLYILGAIIVFPAGIIERHLLISKALNPNNDGLIPILITAFFIAGMVEEFLKAGIFQRGIYHHKEFDEPIDGIVYGVAIALGFAMVENVMYVTSYGLSVAFLRSVTAIPAHMFFGITMGYYFARAKFGLSSVYRAYLIPAFYHGIYDSFAMIDGFLGNVGLTIFLIYLIFLSTRYIQQLRHQAILY
ncbi:PrsW family glutamic-type intramembrane protease [Fodinisporobacter ferrooxydans]|uniref:Protease PrsW n=1 Tax=Fodinisporobacter ferrooxydans TaxID=2901836 RepID=A0ABY4CP35_9BACL|nr:PrsW family glutamic-type intramembrane protease [Alicyclobacillaceae bacterium MYW30-H2]